MGDQWGFCSTDFFFLMPSKQSWSLVREKNNSETQGDWMAMEKWGKKALRGPDFPTWGCTWGCCCTEPSSPTQEHPDPDWPFGAQLGGGLPSGACKELSAKMRKKESQENQDSESPVTCSGNRSGSVEPHIFSLSLSLTARLRSFQLQNPKLCQVLLLKCEFSWITNSELLFLNK